MQKNIVQYSIEYVPKKSVGDGLDFCDLCTYIPRFTLLENILRRSGEIDNITNYRFNKGINAGRIGRNIKRGRDPDNNK